MCGIFGYIGKDNNAPQIVFEGLKKLEYRGYDSWGIAVLGQKSKTKELGSKIIIKKRTGKIGDATIDDLPKSHFALGHTRWATHGGVTEDNAHPHLDCTQNLALIHNGIIENYAELKEELKKLDHKFVSETDSEVAVHLIEENYKKLRTENIDQKLKSFESIFLESVRLAFNRFIGLNAIIAMDAGTQTFVAAKNGSPLVLGKGQGENFLASDAHAILPHTRQLYFMEDQDLVLVSAEKIMIHNIGDGKTKKATYTQIDWDIKTVDKGEFPHFMLKEIFDQPKVIENIANGNEENIRKFVGLLKRSYGTYLIGCGTASYACLAGSYIFSKIAKRHINNANASEFGYTVDFLTSKSLVIALSQSGETIDIIDAVKKAKEKKAQIGALVNVLGSTLYRMADHKLLLEAGTEKAVVSTKAFTAKLAYLILLANALTGNILKGRNELKKAVVSMGEVLSEENLERIKNLTNLISKFKDIYVIGRGLSYPIALETALKIKEASYIHAEGIASGELKHGVIALIEKGTPCIAFLPNDETYGANLAGAMEMKARGGFIIGISYKPHEIFNYYLPVKDSGLSSVISSTVVGQLIGYYLAVKRGHNPDKPRNLAKSVTVK